MDQRRMRLRRTKTPAKSRACEHGGHDLLNSPEAQLYHQLLEARGQDIRPLLDELAKIPLERRYTWRVVSALKWVFADYDPFKVAADLTTLGEMELNKTMQLLSTSDAQFCVLLAMAYSGEPIQEVMKALMGEAVALAKRYREYFGAILADAEDAANEQRPI